jgi:hypothetical protein
MEICSQFHSVIAQSTPFQSRLPESKVNTLFFAVRKLMPLQTPRIKTQLNTCTIHHTISYSYNVPRRSKRLSVQKVRPLVPFPSRIASMIILRITEAYPANLRSTPPPQINTMLPKPFGTGPAHFVAFRPAKVNISISLPPSSNQPPQDFFTHRPSSPPYVTVIYINEDFTCVEEEWLKDIIVKFEKLDDVFRIDFLSGVILPAPRRSSSHPDPTNCFNPYVQDGWRLQTLQTRCQVPHQGFTT